MNSNQLSDYTNSIDEFERACARGELESVKNHIEQGASVLTINRQTGAGPLHFAAQSGSIELFDYLLKQGAYLNQQVPINGMTPLMIAVWHKHTALTEFILSQPQVNIEIVAHYNMKAHDLSQFGYKLPHDEQATALIERFNDLFESYLERRDAIEKQPLFTIILSSDNDREKADRIAQGLASGKIAPSEINDILPHKNSGNDAHTPLLLASRDGLTETVKVLLQHGADQRIVDSYMRSLPLHKAAFSGHSSTVEALLSDSRAGQTVNAQGPFNGYTPLHDAIWNGHTDCARALIAFGAETDVNGHDGYSASDFAKRLKRDEIADLVR